MVSGVQSVKPVSRDSQPGSSAGERVKMGWPWAETPMGEASAGRTCSPITRVRQSQWGQCLLLTLT